MKLHNMSPTELNFRFKNKVKKLPFMASRNIPDDAKVLVFWYDEFQKHTLDLANIRHSNLLSGIANIVLMDNLRIEMTNSLTGYYRDPKRFEWRYVSPEGVSHYITNPVFELDEIKKVKNTKEVDPDKYNEKLDKVTDPNVSVIYWIMLVIVFLVIVFVIAIPLLCFR